MVSRNSQTRVNNNHAFNLIKTNTDWLAEQNDKVYSLNLVKFRENKKKINSTVKQIETLYKLPHDSMWKVCQVMKTALQQTQISWSVTSSGRRTCATISISMKRSML